MSKQLQHCPAVNPIYCAALPNTLPPEQRVRCKHRVKDALLAAGLPAKQAVLLQPSGTTVSASSKDPEFAAPKQPLSVLAANAEARLSKRQAGELGAPEGSVGCRATKAAGRLSQ